jgi:hypothetical protein
MVGPEANIVSACVAYGTEGVEARSVMDEPRANVDWLSPVWSTRGEGLLQPEIGLDAKHNTVLSSGEEGEDFFLDIPSYRTHRHPVTCDCRDYSSKTPMSPRTNLNCLLPGPRLEPGPGPMALGSREPIE